MATVNILQPAFGIKWAQDGTVSAIDEAQWRAGWAFIGATPPSVEQFNKVHQVQDEKSNWLYQQMLTLFTSVSETPTVGDLASLRDSVRAVVKNSGLEFNTWQTLLVNTTLNSTHIGRALQLASATPLTITLPPANSVPSGATLNFKNTQVGVTTLVRSASDTLSFGTATLTSAQIALGEDLMLVSNGANIWFAMSGSAQSRYTSGFSSVLATTGMQMLPSGVLMQWGSILSGGGPVTASFYQAFPGGVPFQVIACGYAAATNVQAYASVNAATASGCTFSAFTAASGAAPVIAPANNVRIQYMALGN